MTLTECLDLLAARLNVIDGLTVTTDPAATVVVPMAVVDVTELDYNESFRRGAAVAEVEVTVYVSRADSPSGLLEVRDYLTGYGASSVPLALETQPAAGDALLNKVSCNAGRPSVGESYVTAKFDVSVHIPGATAT